MKEYTMTRKETTLQKQLLNALKENPNLADELRQAGMDPQFLQNPQDVCYMLDKSKANAKDSIYDLLDAHLEHFRKEEGEMKTVTTDSWGRYPLDAMIHLLWRMRDMDGEVIFMPGNAHTETSPAVWRVTIGWEQNSRVLRCCHKERRCYMYLLLKDKDHSLTQKDFIKEMREFLQFPEDAVWVHRSSTKHIAEVMR